MYRFSWQENSLTNPSLALLLLAIILAIPVNARAEDNFERVGWYVGAGISLNRITAGTFGGLNNASDDFDAGNGYVITIGYRLGRYVAIEVAYADGGTTGYQGEAPLLCVEAEPCSVDIEQETNFTFASLVGVFPLGERWELFAEAGPVMWDAQSDQLLYFLSEPEPSIVQIASDGVDFLISLGAGIRLSDRSQFRLAYRFFDTDDELLAIDRGAGFEQVSVELHWRF